MTTKQTAKHTFTVGQKLWYVTSNRRGESRWIVIAKIGRKWLTCEDCHCEIRIDAETMAADGGDYSSPGKCYLSGEEHRQELLLLSAHDNLYRKLSHRPYLGVTIEDVRAAAKLLRIDIEKGE